MDKLLFIIMTIMLCYIVYKNITIIARYKHNKGYVKLYQEALKNDENAISHINEYIDNEKSQEYKNKARIIRLICLISNNAPEYENAIKELDLHYIFYKNNKVNDNLIKLNSDSFIFIILALAKAYENYRLNIIDDIKSKIMELDGLKNRLEYNEILAFIDAISFRNDKGNKFMHSLLDGSYSEYTYDKNLIGLYKRIASSTLTFSNEDIDEYFKNDLYSFAKTLIGESLLKSLRLYEIYKESIIEKVV